MVFVTKVRSLPRFRTLKPHQATPLQVLALRPQLLRLFLHAEGAAHQALRRVLVEAVQPEGVEIPTGAVA